MTCTRPLSAGRHPSAAVSGSGFGITVGYGINRRVTVYADIARADYGTVDLNTEASMAHYVAG